MGYCYGRGGLVCDKCGEAEGAADGVRKRPCPHGYCQAPALCRKCWATVKGATWATLHAPCAVSAEAYRLERERERALLAAGRSVRCSALGVAGDRVHVLFRDAARRCTGLYMSPDTYHAIPLLSPATPEDYAAIGPCEPAPADFVYGGRA